MPHQVHVLHQDLRNLVHLLCELSIGPVCRRAAPRLYRQNPLPACHQRRHWRSSNALGIAAQEDQILSQAIAHRRQMVEGKSIDMCRRRKTNSHRMVSTIGLARFWEVFLFLAKRNEIVFDSFRTPRLQQNYFKPKLFISKAICRYICPCSHLSNFRLPPSNLQEDDRLIPLFTVKKSVMDKNPITLSSCLPRFINRLDQCLLSLVSRSLVFTYQCSYPKNSNFSPKINRVAGKAIHVPSL